MTTASTGTKRRTLLAGTTRWAGAASPPAASPPSPLALHARARPVAGHHHADGRIVASGDLLDAPDGTRIGTFYANCFCLPTPFGPRASAASNLEFHVLQLEDRTLFSIGSGLDAGRSGELQLQQRRHPGGRQAGPVRVAGVLQLRQGRRRADRPRPRLTAE